jgi:hypothetical protein
MDADQLQDRIYWGLNRVANILGRATDAYRPKGVSDPIKRSNRYLRLPAAFSRADGNFAQSNVYGTALWRGHFDGSYTRVGDYLQQGTDLWFIASLQHLLPILCVKTNRVISITRQTAPATGAEGDIPVLNSTLKIISKWPVSILGVSTDGKTPTHLPGDTAVPSVIALLPAVHGQIVQPTDMVTDERGTNAIVVAAELSDFGWRLNVRQATT